MHAIQGNGNAQERQERALHRMNQMSHRLDNDCIWSANSCNNSTLYRVYFCYCDYRLHFVLVVKYRKGRTNVDLFENNLILA